jgi:hypothetical protein
VLRDQEQVAHLAKHPPRNNEHPAPDIYRVVRRRGRFFTARPFAVPFSILFQRAATPRPIQFSSPSFLI